VSSGGFGNLIGGDSGFAVELAGGADGRQIRKYKKNKGCFVAREGIEQGAESL
jgi:hypothetical protein